MFETPIRRTDEAAGKKLRNEIRKFNAASARKRVAVERRPDAISASYDKTCDNVSDWMMAIANPVFREVFADKALCQTIKDYKSGALGDDVDPEFKEFLKLYTRIQKFIRMVGNPARYHNKSGYPYGSVNFLSSIDAKESVEPERGKYPDLLVSGMRRRIEEEDAELKRLMGGNVVVAKPPYPHIEKRGKIVNLLPEGMNNPNTTKPKDDNGGSLGGRPAKADSDIHTTSWNRDRLVNTHMSKKNKEARR